MPDFDRSIFERFVELTDRKRLLTAQLKQTNEHLAQAERRVMDQLLDMGVDRITVSGRTIYPRRELWANACEGLKPQLVEALKRNGLEEYIQETFNANQLTAYVRELAGDNLSPEQIKDILPPDIAESIKISEIWRVGNTKA